MLSLTPSTVSRALSDHPNISKQTKDRVKEAAVSFNYIPNLHARYFRKKRSGLIALIVPEINAYFMPALLSGIQKALAENGYFLIILHSDNLLEQEKNALNHCLSWVVDGVLIILSEQTADSKHLDLLSNESIPVVMIDKVLPSERCPAVKIDDYKAAYDAVSYLISKGGRHFLGIFDNPALQITQERKRGFEQCLSNHFSNRSDIKASSLHIADSMEATTIVENYMINYSQPDSIFIMSDDLMVNTYNVIMKEWNIQNKYTQMVCISDGIAPYHFPSRVSHVLHSGYDVGRAGALLLIDRIINSTSEATIVNLETKLVVLDT